MKKEYALLIGVGFVSGVANAALNYSLTSSLTEAFIFYGAGIPYGLLTGLYFTRSFPIVQKLLRLTFWTVASVVSYTLGVQAAIDKDSFALGGFVGALVLTVSFHLLFQKMSVQKHVFVVIAGAFVAFVVTIDDYTFLFATLWIVWQTIITTVLGWGLISRKRT